VTLATVVGVAHLPLGERPQYGMPYPEGIAIAASAAADDASGGNHTFSLNADPGFLYRLELCQLTRGSVVASNVHAITVHRWAAAKADFGVTSMDLNWILEPTLLGSTFEVYTLVSGGSSDGLGPDIMKMIGRFPMGPTGGGAPGVSSQLMNITVDAQIDTVTNELSVVWTYWRKEALFLPGFLSAFYEAPAVPPITR